MSAVALNGTSDALDIFYGNLALLRHARPQNVFSSAYNFQVSCCGEQDNIHDSLQIQVTQWLSQHMFMCCCGVCHLRCALAKAGACVKILSFFFVIAELILLGMMMMITITMIVSVLAFYCESHQCVIKVWCVIFVSQILQKAKQCRQTARDAGMTKK